MEMNFDDMVKTQNLLNQNVFKLHHINKLY